VSKAKRRRRTQGITLGGALLTFAVTFALMYLRYSSSHSQYEVKGIDVSHYQGDINWQEVRQDGIQFAFIKATEGVSLVDSQFTTNWEAARANGIRCGAYHFYRPSVLSTDQARHFLSHADLQPGDLPPVLDLEVTDNRNSRIIREGVKNWMEIVENAVGAKPILYTTPKFADAHLRGSLKDYPIWLAHLGRGEPPLPKGHSQWDFWQYSFTGTIRGIEGDVDLDCFRGSPEELAAFTLP